MYQLVHFLARGFGFFCDDMLGRADAEGEACSGVAVPPVTVLASLRAPWGCKREPLPRRSAGAGRRPAGQGHGRRQGPPQDPHGHPLSKADLLGVEEALLVHLGLPR